MTEPQARPIPREDPATRPDVRSYIDEHDRAAKAAVERAVKDEQAEDLDPDNPAPEPAD